MTHRDPRPLGQFSTLHTYLAFSNIIEQKFGMTPLVTTNCLCLCFKEAVSPDHLKQQFTYKQKQNQTNEKYKGKH